MANSASAKRAGRFFVAGLHTCAFSDLLAAVFFPRFFPASTATATTPAGAEDYVN